MIASIILISAVVIAVGMPIVLGGIAIYREWKSPTDENLDHVRIAEHAEWPPITPARWQP